MSVWEKLEIMCEPCFVVEYKIRDFINKSSLNDKQTHDFLAFLELGNLIEIRRNKKNNARINLKSQETEVITNISNKT